MRSQAGWTLKVEKNRVRFDINLFRILEVIVYFPLGIHVDETKRTVAGAGKLPP